ncbi:MAG: CrcB family protein [Nocardioides sp.]
MTVLLVALGAAVGAPLRFVLATRLDGRFPRGTFAVNVAGSLLLGLFSALALSKHEMALLGVGFCGGLTTYSAFAVQTHGLGKVRGTAYAAGTIAASLAACGVGFWVA